jgi:hypothetical protein
MDLAGKAQALRVDLLTVDIRMLLFEACSCYPD